jgi:hypothetical protein
MQIGSAPPIVLTATHLDARRVELRASLANVPVGVAQIRPKCCGRTSRHRPRRWASVPVDDVLIDTSIRVKNVSQSLIDVGVAFVANERQIFSKIILPASLPYVMAALRLGIGRAIIGMVTAELFTAISGLGGLVVKYSNNFRTDEMLVPVLIMMALGVILTGALQRAEQLIAPWRANARDD